MNGRDERPITGEASPGCEVVCRDRLIAVSGQADFDSFAQIPHPADPRAQVVAVVGRIRERLDVGAGALHGGAEARSRRFSPPGPALSDVPVDELAYPGMLVEIEAIAAIGPPARRETIRQLNAASSLPNARASASRRASSIASSTASTSALASLRV